MGKKRTGSNVGWVLVLLMGAGYGALDGWHQGFVPGRDASVGDWMADSAGVVATGTTGTVELRAMYGGLQAAIGVLSALAIFRPALQRPALILLVCICSGLGLARLLASLMAGEFSAYNGGALVFEWGAAAVAVWVLPGTKS